MKTIIREFTDQENQTKQNISVKIEFKKSVKIPGSISSKNRLEIVETKDVIFLGVIDIRQIFYRISDLCILNGYTGFDIKDIEILPIGSRIDVDIIIPIQERNISIIKSL